MLPTVVVIVVVWQLLDEWCAWRVAKQARVVISLLACSAVPDSSGDGGAGSNTMKMLESTRRARWELRSSKNRGG